jgi:anthranilate phosphoribosyltransferase
VSSEDGLDEMSTAAPTHVVEVNGDAIERYTVSAGDVGLAAAPEDAVAGGTPDVNARVTRAILAGDSGPHADLAYLNAGAAIYAAGRAETLADGVQAAREACTSGAATATLDSYVGLSLELAG